MACQFLICMIFSWKSAVREQYTGYIDLKHQFLNIVSRAADLIFLCSMFLFLFRCTVDAPMCCRVISSSSRVFACSRVRTSTWAIHIKRNNHVWLVYYVRAHLAHSTTYNALTFLFFPSQDSTKRVFSARLTRLELLSLASAQHSTTQHCTVQQRSIKHFYKHSMSTSHF